MSQGASSSATVGVDLGGTHIQFGVVDATNRIIGRARDKTGAADGRDAVIDRLVSGVHAACAEAGITLNDVDAVGVAAAGAIDIPDGVILNAPNLGWHQFALRDVLRTKLNARIVLENDVNGAVWAEYMLGAVKGRGDVLGVWIGTGVGGGLVLNGRLYHGDRFTAGEIGHTVMDLDEPPGRRTLEEISSRTAISRAVVARMHEYPDSIVHALFEDEPGFHGSGMLGQAYKAIDPLTVDVVHRAADVVGVAIANFVTVLSLDTVIVGGGVTEVLGEPWLARIRASFEQAVFPDELRTCRMVPTELEDNAGLLGAALLARAEPTTDDGTA